MHSLAITSERIPALDAIVADHLGRNWWRLSVWGLVEIGVLLDRMQEEGLTLAQSARFLWDRSRDELLRENASASTVNYHNERIRSAIWEAMCAAGLPTDGV